MPRYNFLKSLVKNDWFLIIFGTHNLEETGGKDYAQTPDMHGKLNNKRINVIKTYTTH